MTSRFGCTSDWASCASGRPPRTCCYGLTEAAALERLAAARASLDALDARDALGHLTVVARGYATLDLDEAQAHATQSVAHDEVRSAADDTLLGARCRVVVTVGRPWIVLL